MNNFKIGNKEISPTFYLIYIIQALAKEDDKSIRLEYASQALEALGHVVDKG